MLNTKQNVANIKNKPKMVVSTWKMVNEEGNNTTSTPNLQESNEKSFINTVRKIVKEKFKEHETKMSEMITDKMQMTIYNPSQNI